MYLEKYKGKSILRVTFLSEILILALINPNYENQLFIEIQDQYKNSILLHSGLNPA